MNKGGVTGGERREGEMNVINLYSVRNMEREERAEWG